MLNYQLSRECGRELDIARPYRLFEESTQRWRAGAERGQRDRTSRVGGERRADSSPGSGVGRGRAGQLVQTRAHLGDRRLISLACRRVDEPSGKELFQPQVVVQDHLEQGTLGGRQAGRVRQGLRQHRLTQTH